MGLGVRGFGGCHKRDGPAVWDLAVGKRRGRLGRRRRWLEPGRRRVVGRQQRLLGTGQLFPIVAGLATSDVASARLGWADLAPTRVPPAGLAHAALASAGGLLSAATAVVWGTVAPAALVTLRLSEPLRWVAMSGRLGDT